MFTGIIEEVGTVRRVVHRPGGAEITIACRTVLEGTRLGDSISVDGVCLTVTDCTTDGFTVGLQPVTLEQTALGQLKPGDRVNLERALAVNGRLGGHYVQGHVDGVGRITSKQPHGEAMIVRITVPPAIRRYLVERGYIAVDGASLTIMTVHPDGLSVSLVRYTQQHITLPQKPVGALVNLEVDVMAKYVERLLVAQSAAPGGVTPELLVRAGFWEAH